MNVSRQAVSKWESNQSVPDIEKIVDLSELFGVTTDSLLKSGAPSFELPKKQAEEGSKTIPAISDDEINKYLTASEKAAHYYSLTPAFIFSGIAAFYVLLTISLVSKTFTYQTSGVVIALILLALASGCFINAKLILHDFKTIKRGEFTLNTKQKSEISSKTTDFKKKNNRRIIIAVVTFNLSIIPPVILLYIRNSYFWNWLGISLMFIGWAISSYAIVSYITQKNAFTTIALEKKRLPKDDKESLIKNSVVFLACTAHFCLPCSSLYCKSNLDK